MNTHMKNLSSISLVITMLFLSVACGKDDDGGCLTLNEHDYYINIQEQYTQLPSKVSVFFKVDDHHDQPVAGLQATHFTVYEKGRNDACPQPVSAFEANVRFSSKSQIFSFNTMLLLDLSGSVIENSLEELQQASIRFIESIMPDVPDPSYQMGIWWFDGEDRLHELTNFTSQRDVLIGLVESIDPELSTDPSTDLYGAVIKATDRANTTLDEHLAAETIAAASIVLFTDGTDQAARYSKEEALQAVNSSKNRISYFTIGLGSEIDEATLTELGAEASIIAESNEELEDIFVETANLVFDEANSYYLLEYCSPKRDGSGLSELIIEATKDDKKGSTTTSFDATGFSSGCN